MPVGSVSKERFIVMVNIVKSVLVGPIGMVSFMDVIESGS